MQEGLKLSYNFALLYILMYSALISFILKGSRPLPMYALLTGHRTVSDTLSEPWNFLFICKQYAFVYM